MVAARYRGLALAGAVLLGALSPFEAVAEPLRLGVVSASAGFYQKGNQAVVDVRLTEDSRRQFAEFTQTNLGRMIDVRVDGKSVNKPVVREPITGGSLQISVDRSDDAGPLAARLNDRTAVLEVEAAPR